MKRWYWCLAFPWAALLQAGVPSNDTLDLEPRIGCTAERVLTFDFPAMRVGVAQYDEGPTGTTVFLFQEGVSATSDVRGGSVGVTGEEFNWLNALVFSGGSLFGLEAPYGVQAELHRQKDYAVGWGGFSLVAGAIIYDFFGRDNAVYPDKALGRAAVRGATTGVFPMGRCGAGVRAGIGQGGAFRSVGSVKVGVFTVVNALGRIVDREGRIRGPHRRSAIAEVTARHGLRANVTENTTLTLVVTNVANLGPSFARQVHASMARAIQPFHTDDDGDVLWAVSTNEVTDSALKGWELGVIASELAWDAVLAALPEDEPDQRDAKSD